MMKVYAHPALGRIPLQVMMHALSDPVRLAIVRSLLATRNKEMACNEIPLKVVKATRSHHFSVLRAAGLIFTRCDGTKCMTSVRREEIERRFPGLLELIGARERKSRRMLARV